MSNQHPGFIVYINEKTNTEERVDISEIPKDEHFVNGIPIVKVVLIPFEGNRAKVCEFGPGDRLLQTHSGTLGD
jgi:hypothetical protein